MTPEEFVTEHLDIMLGDAIRATSVSVCPADEEDNWEVIVCATPVHESDAPVLRFTVTPNEMDEPEIYLGQGEGIPATRENLYSYIISELCDYIVGLKDRNARRRVRCSRR
jgi:hypothetical protein